MIKEEDRVTYRDVNLCHYKGVVKSVVGPFCMVIWNQPRHIGPVKEWGPNLKVLSSIATTDEASVAQIKPQEVTCGRGDRQGNTR